MKKQYVMVSLLIGILLVSSSVCAQNTAVTSLNLTVNNHVPIEQTGMTGRINWGQESQTVEAIGTGVAPANFQTVAQARALARRAAIVEAYRNLAETIQGVRVDAHTTVQNLAIQNDTINTKVSGIIRGARVVREGMLSDGATYVVIMSVPLYGAGSIAEIALEATNPSRIQEIPRPTGTSQITSSSIYTGVIIDAREFQLEPTFSPRIYDETGRIVYGNMYINTNFAIAHGIVEYSLNEQMLQSAFQGRSRAGKNPLVVKAVAIKDNNCNVVISNADADQILRENMSGGFLKACGVVFAK